MCGISVILSLPPPVSNGTNGTPCQPKIESERLEKSLELIDHRGPDARGTWIDPTSTVGLGHCRLTIIDLTESGNQPLHDDEGHIHAVVNGEIYDHDRLRRQCADEFGYKFHGTSDSEVVLALYKRYGAPEFLEHCRGEFSIVIYDDRTGELLAVRDRFGIKPLFWTICGNEMFIASEAKAFLPLGWKPEWNVEAIAQRTSYMGETTLFKGVHRLKGGHYMTVARDGTITDKKYWDLDFCDKRQVDHRTTDEMIQEIRKELIDAIRLRLRADVPVGVYLSGGVDSSMVAGIVKHLIDTEGASMGSQPAKERVTALTLEFDSKNKDSIWNEASIASRTAEWLGVRSIMVDANEQLLADQFEDLIWYCESTTHNLSVIAKLELSKRARESGVKVILTGEGADEMFAGYPWYLLDHLQELDHSQPGSRLVPDPDALADMYAKYNKQFGDLWAGVFDPGFTKVVSELSPEVYRLINNSRGPMAWDFETGRNVLKPELRARYGPDIRVRAMAEALLGDDPERLDKLQHSWHPLHSSMYLLTWTLLANYIIPVNADRTEMANSLEGRPPLLDHKLADLVSRMPPSVKTAYCPEDAIEGPASQSAMRSTAADPVQSYFREKWILREVARPFITDEVYNRPKHAFMAGSRWAVGGPLHRVFSRLLTRDNVEDVGFLDWDTIERSLAAAFGEGSNVVDFMNCFLAAGYVTIGQRFGVPKASLSQDT